MIPENIGLFRFRGFGPEPSLGLAAVTQGGKLVLADSQFNEGTSLTNAIESAIETARTLYGLPAATPIYQWTPNDPVVGPSLWQVELGAGGPTWTRAAYADEEDLAAAVRAIDEGGVN